jgi:LPXTG-motif cell wall-anchored protein
MRGSSAPTVPPDLTTGCFVPRDQVPGVGACAQRTTHAGLNKDNGIIDPSSGNATAPSTPRGKVGDNFDKAVAGAVVETRHQWRDFQAGLRDTYGAEKAALMACALTHDDPSNDCPAHTGRTIVLAVSGVVIVVLVAGLVFRRRRRAKVTSQTVRRG